MTVRKAGGIGLALGAVLIVAAAPRPSGAQGLLLGTNPRPFRPPPVDSSLPSGTERWLPDRLDDAVPLACSFDHPICVHSGAEADPGDVLRVLDAAVRAYADIVVALDLPEPRRLPWEPRSRITVSLDGASRGRSGDDVAVDEVPNALGAFDAASTVCHLRYGLRGRALDRAAAICIGEAIAGGLDAGMTPHLRRAYATHLWWAVGGATVADVAAIEAFQKAPEAAVFGVERTESSEGAALLFDFLDGYGAAPNTGELATAIVSRAGSKTPLAATTWRDEPDLVDVLTNSFEASALSWPHLLGDFAYARGLFGSSAAQWLALGAGRSLPSYRPRFDWRISLSSLPRRLLTRSPVEPTGTTFVWVDFDVRPGEGAALGLRAECEAPVAFEWEVVKLQGSELKPQRVPVAFQDRAQTVERTVSELQHTRALLVAGTNLGAISSSFPFDPDIYPFEPHSCTVYLALL